MRRIAACLLLIGALTAFITRVSAQDDASVGFRSFPESVACREWRATLAEQSADAQGIVNTVLQDARTKIAAARRASPDDVPDIAAQKRQLAQTISQTRAVEVEMIGALEALLDEPERGRLRGAMALFEYERLRTYCDWMRLPHSLPNIRAVMDVASIDLAALQPDVWPESQVSFATSIGQFWNDHVEELNTGIDYHRSLQHFATIASGAVHVLRDYATSLGVDLESVQAALMVRSVPRALRPYACGYGVSGRGSTRAGGARGGVGLDSCRIPRDARRPSRDPCRGAGAMGCAGDQDSSREQVP